MIKAEGIVDDYAIAGAMALLFWTEPVPTYDLDVLAFLPDPGTPLVSLDPIYRSSLPQARWRMKPSSRRRRSTTRAFRSVSSALNEILNRHGIEKSPLG